ncbi:MAG: MBL fold metallo-hydrolase [Planctomycetota bacterium]|nr:MBL fold metallo-hydrolase [Planctomycetota bacterium]
MTIQIKPFALGDYQTNCFIVTSGDDCWVIDCGYEPDVLIEYLKSNVLKPKALLLTHCHSDHIAGIDQLLSFTGNIPIHAHAQEQEWNMNPMLNLSGLAGRPVTASSPTETLTDGQTLTLSDSTWRVVHTPGHSPGSVCFIHDESNQAIVGDTLFAGSIGRHDFPTSNVDDLRNSIQKTIMSLPDDMMVYPGHGPSTTIGRERQSNPFVVHGF